MGAARTSMSRNWASASVSIAAGSSLSASLISAGRPIIGLQMSPFWTAASISFDGTACPGGVMYPIYDDAGTQVAIPTAGSRLLANQSRLEKLAGVYAFRVRSGCGAASATDQASARTLVVFMQG